MDIKEIGLKPNIFLPIDSILCLIPFFNGTCSPPSTSGAEFPSISSIFPSGNIQISHPAKYVSGTTCDAFLHISKHSFQCGIINPLIGIFVFGCFIYLLPSKSKPSVIIFP